MLKHIGFTGTKEGMTRGQKTRLKYFLLNLLEHDGAEYFHHGDCVGADAEAHAIAKQLGYRVVLHPPDNPKNRAFCEADFKRKPLPYLQRNKEIVLESNLIVATPKESREVLRSGTWSTVRYTLI